MEYLDIDISQKSNFKPNMLVDISVDGKIERGWIAKVLSSGNTESGIKVQLTNGKIGRVYGVPNKNDLERKNFKFYNLLMNTNQIYAIFFKKENQIFVLKDAYLYLFSDKEIAEQSIKGTAFENPMFQIRSFPNATKFLKYLEKNQVSFQYIIIDKTRQLTRLQFEEIYKKFYNC